MNELNQVINPYIAGSPVTGAEMFYGRQDVFDFIGQTLSGRHRDQIIVLYGQRRTGKTSVLYQMHRHLDERYIPIFIDLHGLALQGVDGFLWELANHIRRALARQQDINLPPLDRATFLADAREQFADVFLGQVWQAIGARHLLLMLDEAIRLQEQVAAGQMEAQVFDYVRHLMQHYPRLNFLFSLGSGLEEMEKNYALLFNVALYKRISFLERQAAVGLITVPAAEHFSVAPAAVDHILNLTSCHPYYTQLICHSLFNRWQQSRAEQLTAADVDATLEEVVERGLAVLKYTWEESNPAERAVMAGLAQAMGSENRPVSLAAVARAWSDLGVTLPEGQMNQAVKSLIAREVIAGQERFAFTVALQRMWIQRYERLEWVKEEIAEERAGWAAAMGVAEAEPLPLESGVMTPADEREPAEGEQPGRRLNWRRFPIMNVAAAIIALVWAVFWVIGEVSRTECVDIRLHPSDQAVLSDGLEPFISRDRACIAPTFLSLDYPDFVYAEPVGAEQLRPDHLTPDVRLEVPEGYELGYFEEDVVHIFVQDELRALGRRRPVSLTGRDPGLAASFLPPEVWALFIGPPEVIDDYMQQNPVASVSVGGLGPGVYVLPVKVDQMTPNVQVVMIRPDQVRVVLSGSEAARPPVPAGEASLVNGLLAIGDYVWAATEGGLVRWAPDLGGDLNPGRNLGLPDDCVQAIAASPSGDALWLACGGVVKAAVGPDGSPQPEQYFSRDEGLEMGLVRALMVDEDGSVWAGGPGPGDDTFLAYFDGREWNNQPLVNPEALARVDVSIGSMLTEESGFRWFGLEADGILRWSPGWVRYDLADIRLLGAGEDLRIRNLIQTVDGDIWAAASDRGLLVFRPEQDRWEQVPLPIGAPVRAVLQLSNGSLVATGDAGGTIGFVAISHDGGGSWELLADEADGVGSDAGGLAEDPGGRLWVGSYGMGVSVYDGQTWTHLQR